MRDSLIPSLNTKSFGYITIRCVGCRAIVETAHYRNRKYCANCSYDRKQEWSAFHNKAKKIIKVFSKITAVRKFSPYLETNS